jgi:hypothetical protein
MKNQWQHVEMVQLLPLDHQSARWLIGPARALEDGLQDGLAMLRIVSTLVGLSLIPRCPTMKLNSEDALGRIELPLVGA